MINKKFCGILALCLVFGLFLAGCDILDFLNVDYTIYNNSSYPVSGNIGGSPFSVGIGSSTTVNASIFLTGVEYSPADLVEVDVNMISATITFTDSYY